VVIVLDITRARQILQSTQKIDVLLNGSPVWIEGVSDNSIAEVTALTGSRHKREVPVGMLIERI
jgi:H-type small acid-soluble spore protein